MNVGEMMEKLTIGSDEIRAHKNQYEDDFKIKNTTSFTEQVIDYFYTEQNSGKSLGLPKLDEGFLARPSELTLVTGISGHGKTQILMQWVHSLSQTSKALIMSLEMRPEITLARLCKIALGKNSTGAPPTEEFIRKYCKSKEEKIYIYDQTGVTNSDDVYAACYYAKNILGCDFIVLDSLTKIDDVGEGQDAYDKQKHFVNSLASICRDIGIHMFLVCHLRKTEEDKPPTAQDIYGSSNIRNLCDNILLVYRNIPKQRKLADPKIDDEDLKGVPDTIVYIQKQRNFPYEGSFGFYFNKNSLTFHGSPV